MATFTIKAGQHAHTFWPVSFLPWWGGRDTVTRTRRVKFGNPDCVYDSPAYNAEDVNKLWGLSFGFLPHRLSTLKGHYAQGDDAYDHQWLVPEHWNSARFGWVWSVSQGGWKQLAYCYANGVKNWDAQLRYPQVALILPDQLVDETISYDRRTGEVIFFVREAGSDKLLGSVIKAQLPPNLPLHGWQLGFWFGGTLPAAHRMSVDITPI